MMKDTNIIFLRGQIQLRKAKLMELRHEKNLLESRYQKSGSESDQLQFINAKIKMSEAEAGLTKMVEETSLLIQSRVKELEVEDVISREADFEIEDNLDKELDDDL